MHQGQLMQQAMLAKAELATLAGKITALTAAEKAVPANAVTSDGEVDWKKAVADFNDKYVGPPTTVGAIGTAPSEGWALFRLLQNQRRIGQDAKALQTAFSEIVGPVAYQLDQGLTSLADLNYALSRWRNGVDAAAVLGGGPGARAYSRAQRQADCVIPAR